MKWHVAHKKDSPYPCVKDEDDNPICSCPISLRAIASMNSVAWRLAKQWRIARSEEHAALIAAAPDLLAALEAIIDYGMLSCHPDTTKQARAAIAKATQKG